MSNPFRSIAIAMAVFSCVGLSAASGNLITNGGFETSDFSAWTLAGNTSDPTTYGVDESFPYQGMYAAYFGPYESKIFLLQTITTTPGQVYELDFFLTNEDGTSPNEFSVNFGSTNLYDATNLPTFVDQEYHYLVTATETTTVVTFGFQNDYSFFDIDNVSVTLVPEPGSLICFASGAILFGLHGYRRRLASKKS